MLTSTITLWTTNIYREFGPSAGFHIWCLIRSSQQPCEISLYFLQFPDKNTELPALGPQISGSHPLIFPPFYCFPTLSESNTVVFKCCQPLPENNDLKVQSLQGTMARGRGYSDICLGIRTGCWMKGQEAAPGSHLVGKSHGVFLPPNSRCQDNQALLKARVS